MKWELIPPYANHWRVKLLTNPFPPFSFAVHIMLFLSCNISLPSILITFLLFLSRTHAHFPSLHLFSSTICTIFSGMPRVPCVRVKHSEDDRPWGRHFPLQRQETFSLRWRRRGKVEALNWLCFLSCSFAPSTCDSFSQYLMLVLCSVVVCWLDPRVWSQCLAWSFSRLIGLLWDVTLGFLHVRSVAQAC